MNKNSSDHPLWPYITIIISLGTIIISVVLGQTGTDKIIAISIVALIFIIVVIMTRKIENDLHPSSFQRTGKITLKLPDLSKIKVYKAIRLLLIVSIIMISLSFFFVYSHNPFNNAPISRSPIVHHATPTPTPTPIPTPTPDPTKLISPVYIGWIGTDRYLYIAPYDPSNPNQPPGKETQIVQLYSSVSSNTSPAIAFFDNRLYIVWTGSDQQIYFTRYNNEGQETISPLNGLESNYSPAIAFFDNQLYVAWVGTRDHQLNIAAYFLDQNNLPDQSTMQQSLLQQFSYSSPALAATSSQLYIAWTGTDKQLNLTPYTLNQPIIQSNLSPAQYALNGTSPALAATSNQLYIAWTGTDKQLNLLHYDPNLTIAPTFLLQYTNTKSRSNSTGPALIISNNYLYIAWLNDWNQQLEIAPCVPNQALTAITDLPLKSITSPALTAQF